MHKQIDYDDWAALQIILLFGVALITAATYRALQWLSSRQP